MANRRHAYQLSSASSGPLTSKPISSASTTQRLHYKFGPRIGRYDILWLIMEAVCTDLTEAHCALFSDNSPTVGWVRRLASKYSTVAAQLLWVLALRLKMRKASPLTSLHIGGTQNAMTYVPSQSFGSNAKWHCKTDSELLTLFNRPFPLPNKSSWTVFCPTYEFSMRDYMRVADAGFYAGRVEETTKNRELYWRCWNSVCRPMGVDSTLQTFSFKERVRALSTFAGAV